ncbi:hypothetical protein ACOSQ3_026746 [Xanthoceras sorbifolium]
MSVLRRQCNYSKLDKKDPEEVLHRKAQVLIYKVMEQADNNSSPRRKRRRGASFLRIRLQFLCLCVCSACVIYIFCH